MKYATWKIKFDTNLDGGSTPEIAVKNAGGYCEGAFYLDDETIIGYFENVEISDYEQWQMTEISANDFIHLAKLRNPKNEFNNNGMLKFIENETLFV